ncbi:MAG: protein translocase subunit SecF [Clostridiales bacterium]|nr:protein translocase subunit SecF [Clostridiales bacterium]
MKLQNRSRICLCISAGIMALALILSIFGLGINFGIDFAGGLTVQYDMGATFEQSDIQDALRAQGIEEFTVSTAGADGHSLQVRIAELAGDDEIQNFQSEFEAALLEKYPTMNTDTATVGYVGPIAGAALVKNALISVLLASALMLVYIAFRFNFNFGVAAVIGLLHDVLIMVSFMVLLRNMIQMNSSFIAAMLTIVGYSINNTIVIFDRIRENNKKPAYAGKPRDEVVTISVRESLGRTINTTLTTLVTIVTLYVLGVDSIREFSLPIIIGILSGVYSANLINGYVWAFLEEKGIARKGNKKLNTKKA